LDAIVVGVAVKFAKVPPTAATATTEIAAKLRRSFETGRFLNMVPVSPFSVDRHTIGTVGMETRVASG